MAKPLEFAAKAHRVELLLKDGRTAKLPAKALMFHDETGAEWPARSVLIASGYELTREPVILGPTAARWLGRDYQGLEGKITLPPRDLRAWQIVGEAEEIYYVRRGTFAPGRFHHAFKRERFIFPDHGLTMVYALGAFRRLDLPPSGVINWRGFVKP